MIDIRELTIGCLVTGGMGEVLKVDVIDGVNNHVSLSYPNATWSTHFTSCESIKPLPITPELLLQMGFTDLSTIDGAEWGWQWNEDFSLYNYSVTEVEPGRRAEQYLIDCDTHLLTWLTGVHHLQQLIYALEGEFLTPAQP